MIMDIAGKVAVVTGGSAGIGLAIAKALADAGAGAIVIGDIDDTKGEAAVAGISTKAPSQFTSTQMFPMQIKSAHYTRRP